MLTLPPLSLYIHIPWCVRKCPYCDFNSHAKRDDALPEYIYIDSLMRDLESELPFVKGRKITSIFFGGGTPSLFSADAIGDILRRVNQSLSLDEHCEITLEANPGTFEQEKFKGFFEAGINRLSIGVQSFAAHHLQKLGRIHNGDEAKRAIDIAQRAGFTNVNVDLMHGLPDQTVAEACNDIKTALSSGAKHLSWYQLTIEQNTAFYSAPPILPEEDTLCDIGEAGLHVIKDHAFEQYEVSAYSLAGHQSRHNINYWQFGDYIGIGAGAHGKFTLPDEHRIIRSQKTRTPEHYMSIDSINTAKYTAIEDKDLVFEFMMNALRLNGGVSANLLTERTGAALSQLEPTWNQLKKQGLMVDSNTRIATTPKGSTYLNSVLEKFLD